MWYTPDRLGRGRLQALGLGKGSEPKEERERRRELHVSGAMVTWHDLMLEGPNCAGCSRLSHVEIGWESTAVQVKYLSVSALKALTSLQPPAGWPETMPPFGQERGSCRWSMERPRHQDSSLVRRQGASRNASIDSPPLIGVPCLSLSSGPGPRAGGGRRQQNMVQPRGWCRGRGPPLTAGDAGSRDSSSKVVVIISSIWSLLRFGGVRVERERDDSLGPRPQSKRAPLLICWPSRFSGDRGAVKVSLGLAGRKRLPAWRHHFGPMAAPENRGIPSSRALSCLGSGGHQGAHGSDFGPAAQCARSRPSLVFWHSSLPESHARELFVEFLPTFATIFLLALRNPNPRPDAALLTPEAGIPSPFLDALCEP